MLVASSTMISYVGKTSCTTSNDESRTFISSQRQQFLHLHRLSRLENHGFRSCPVILFEPAILGCWATSLQLATGKPRKPTSPAAGRKGRPDFLPHSFSRKSRGPLKISIMGTTGCLRCHHERQARRFMRSFENGMGKQDSPTRCCRFEGPMIIVKTRRTKRS